MSNHTLDMLGATLIELAPLIAEALCALDKPGTRALRRKIDGSFHLMVHGYGTLRRESGDERDWSKMDLPRYKRATAVWPGQQAYDSRKAREARAAVEAPTVTAPELLATRGLRVVVDNTRAPHLPLSATQIEGDAA